MLKLILLTFLIQYKFCHQNVKIKTCENFILVMKKPAIRFCITSLLHELNLIPCESNNVSLHNIRILHTLYSIVIKL